MSGLGNNVKLVPFSSQYLRMDERLPFGVRDSTGKLLLAAGAAIENPDQLEFLSSKELFCDHAESSEWRRKLGATMDGLLRKNAYVGAFSRATVGSGAGAATIQAQKRTLQEQCVEMVWGLDSALRDAKPNGDWIERVLAIHERARALGKTKYDAAVYYLIYHSANSTEKYSAHHAMLCMLVCELTAQNLGWDAATVDSLGRAALTMNVAMVRLQDHLSNIDRALDEPTKVEVHAHALLGSKMLRVCGVKDDLWADTVRYHHEPFELTKGMAELPQARQMARLLRRVDIFTAKLSCRKSRKPMSPVMAAKEACLGATGVPDEIGGALLKSVGLYPPGSFVELANTELGVVVARGARANHAFVGGLIGTNGMPLTEPSLRDTSDPRFAIKGIVMPSKINVRPPHDRLMTMR